MQQIVQSPVFPMVMMFVVLYFFFLRPKQKEMAKADQMRKNLKKGDNVVMASGLIGVVHSVSDHTVIVKADESTKLEFEKASVARVVSEAAPETK